MGPFLEVIRLVDDETHNGPFSEVNRLVDDETHNGPFSEVYRLVDDESPYLRYYPALPNPICSKALTVPVDSSQEIPLEVRRQA